MKSNRNSAAARFLMALAVLVPAIITFALVAAVWTSPALAGPNIYGTFIVHSTDLELTSQDYCGDAPLSACEDAVVRDDSGEPSVWSVYAAFPLQLSPRLKAVSFGIEYDPNVTILDLGTCGDFEVATPDWPASDEGVGMTFTEAQTTHLVELYWFAGYAVDGPGQFGIIPHPLHGGTFADDSVPAIIDPAADYGVLGFGQEGYLPCPYVHVPGACCDELGYCTFVLPFDCPGDWLGGPCEPNPCPGPVGACCYGPDWEFCAIASYYNCVEELQGLWDGNDYCDPNPCLPIPTQECTWGSIKATYR